MIIRLCEYNFLGCDCDTGLDNPKIIKAYNESNIDKIIFFVKEMMNRGVRVGDDWYTICDMIWSFPENRENVPSLDIYVCEGYEP